MQKTKYILKLIAGALALVAGIYFARESILNFFDIPTTGSSNLFFISTTAGVCNAIIAFVLFYFVVDMIVNQTKNTNNYSKAPIWIIAIYSLCQIIMQITNMIVYSIWSNGGLWFNVIISIVLFSLCIIAITGNNLQKTNILAIVSSIILIAMPLFNYFAISLYASLAIIIALVLTIICYAINLNNKNQHTITPSKIE